MRWMKGSTRVSFWGVCADDNNDRGKKTAMKKVYTANSPVELAHAQNILDGFSIASQKRNELFAVRGEIPFIECYPELWVVNDLDESRARQIIAEEMNREPSGKTWQCTNCDEVCEDQFSDCWNCGSARP